MIFFGICGLWCCDVEVYHYSQWFGWGFGSYVSLFVVAMLFWPGTAIGEGRAFSGNCGHIGLHIENDLLFAHTVARGYFLLTPHGRNTNDQSAIQTVFISLCISEWNRAHAAAFADASSFAYVQYVCWCCLFLSHHCKLFSRSANCVISSSVLLTTMAMHLQFKIHKICTAFAFTHLTITVPHFDPIRAVKHKFTHTS